MPYSPEEKVYRITADVQDKNNPRRYAIDIVATSWKKAMEKAKQMWYKPSKPVNFQYQRIESPKYPYWEKIQWITGTRPFRHWVRKEETKGRISF